jgi:hypothetical protein
MADKMALVMRGIVRASRRDAKAKSPSWLAAGTGPGDNG